MHHLSLSPQTPPIGELSLKNALFQNSRGKSDSGECILCILYGWDFGSALFLLLTKKKRFHKPLFAPFILGQVHVMPFPFILTIFAGNFKMTL